MKMVFYGIGVGPGDPGLITVKAIRTIERCGVIAAPQTGDGRMLALDVARQAVSLAGKTVLPLPFSMSRDAAVRRKSHREAAEQVLAYLQAGESVGMLNIGDVSLYATVRYIRDIVEPEGFACELIPGVPSFCAVAAALGETLTPEMDTPLHILPAGCPQMEQALDYPGTKVIMKAGKPLPEVKALLRRHGLYHKAKAVCNCGMADEQILDTLDEADGSGAYFTTVVVAP